MIKRQTVVRNSEAPWNEFGPEYYTQYKKIIWEDRCLSRWLQGALAAYDFAPGSFLKGLDVCNGGVLRGPAYIAPYMSTAGSIDWMDLDGSPQLEYAKLTIERGRQGDLGIWSIHQTDMGEWKSAWSGAGFRACQLGKAVAGNIFTLPKDQYDIGITCFGPESLTSARGEWRDAVNRFIQSVRPGGPVIMLAMYDSTGYNSPGRDFPATSIEEVDLLKIIGGQLEKIQTYSVLGSHTARPDDTSDYRAMGGVIGIRQ